MRSIHHSILLAGLVFLSNSCAHRLPACQDIAGVSPRNYYQQNLNTGSFTFSAQVQPKRCLKKPINSQMGIFFTVRVYNNADMSSPLRKVCGSMQAYNAANEYLLNRLRQDLRLECGDETCAPTDFWFENNYNAVPFETFKVGFIPPKSFFQKNARVARFVYADRVFTGDTFRFHYPKSMLQAEVNN